MNREQAKYWSRYASGTMLAIAAILGSSAFEEKVSGNWEHNCHLAFKDGPELSKCLNDVNNEAAPHRLTLGIIGIGAMAAMGYYGIRIVFPQGQRPSESQSETEPN